jgi:hypothetical protein
MEEQVENKDFMPKAQVEIMLEDIRSDFKVFGEGLNDVKKTVDLILEDIDEIKSDIVDMKSDIVYIKTDIVDIKLRLDNIDEKLENKAKKTVTDNHETRIVKLEKASLVSA